MKEVLNILAMHLQMLSSLSTDFCSDEDKYRLANTLEILWVLSSYQFHLCKSKHAENILQVVGVKDLESVESKLNKKGLTLIKNRKINTNLMKSDKFPHSQHLCMITSSSGIKPLNNRGYITEDTSIHQSYTIIIALNMKATSSLFHLHLHPTSITQMVKIFSASVFGATFPKPTEVSEVNVKYRAVTYLD
jgi:hypothetical protein